MSSSTIKIGIDLGGTKIAGVAIDRDGKVLRANRLDTPTSGYDAIMDAIDALVNELDPTGDVPIGVGTPGAISPTSGTLRNANTVCLNGTPFPEDLSRRCGRSVRIANDANCFALSEAVDGAGRDAHCVFGVILGTGVGGGVVYSRRLLEGRNAIGGEWGHNPLPWPAAHELPGPACYCGKSGCIETWLSGPGLALDHGEAHLTAQEIAHSASRGDSECLASLGRYQRRLAKSLATVINVLDPDVIVLGGGLSNIASLYSEVPKLWSEYVFSDAVQTRLVPAVHGDAGGVRGAAWLWND